MDFSVSVFNKELRSKYHIHIYRFQYRVEADVRMATYKERVTAIFKKYDPERVNSADAVLKKYVGKEEAAIKALLNKYGATVEPPAAAASATKAVSYKDRMTAIFKKYDPERLHSVDTVLKKYQGKEEAAIKSLLTKYGAKTEPAAETRTYKERMTAIFNKYDPDRVNAVNGTLKKYAGREEVAIKALLNKYGATEEPVDTGIAATGFVSLSPPPATATATATPSSKILTPPPTTTTHMTTREAGSVPSCNSSQEHTPLPSFHSASHDAERPSNSGTSHNNVTPTPKNTQSSPAITPQVFYSPHPKIDQSSSADRAHLDRILGTNSAVATKPPSTDLFHQHFSTHSPHQNSFRTVNRSGGAIPESAALSGGGSFKVPDVSATYRYLSSQASRAKIKGLDDGEHSRRPQPPSAVLDLVHAYGKEGKGAYAPRSAADLYHESIVYGNDDRATREGDTHDGVSQTATANVKRSIEEANGSSRQQEYREKWAALNEELGHQGRDETALGAMLDQHRDTAAWSSMSPGSTHTAFNRHVLASPIGTYTGFYVSRTNTSLINDPFRRASQSPRAHLRYSVV